MTCRILSFFAAIAVLAVSVAPASAQTSEVGARFCVLANAGDLTIKQAYDRRSEFDCQPNALKREANHIWLLGNIEDAFDIAPDPALKLRLSYHGAIEFAQFSDQKLIAQSTYSPADLAKQALVPAQIILPLTPTGNRGSSQVLIGIDRVWDLTNWTDIEIVSQSEVHNHHIAASLVYGLMTGLLLTPLVLICLVYPILRHSFLPFHFGMLSCALLYGLSWSGLINALPVTIEPIPRSIINHISVSFAFMFACFLTRELCGRETLGQFWSRALPVAGIMPVMASLVLMALAPNFSHYGSVVYHAFFIMPLIIIIGALSYGSFRGILICKLQLLAWTPMIFYAVGRIGRGMGYIDETSLLELGLYPALITEGLLTTSIVSYRIFSLRKERDLALHRQTILHDLASFDDLTGAMNRRTFIQHFNQISRAGLAKSQTMSLLVVDIDNFKQVNDTFGHAVGDDVLKRLTKLLKAHCRGEDACARFGGEEFCLLLTTPSQADADICASRLLQAVSEHVFPVVDQITVSIGIVSITPDPAVSFESWFQAADKSLYVAKTQGRNRIQRSGWKPEEPAAADADYAAGWQVLDA
ncbi:MAG: GGDEF domain-containing protein [Henriciella sp.]|nr:GGDEF domain-containing protein [Henriciella sp.]